ncbi:MAG: xanthine dehydrogenase family protein subunit M [Planctomycetota bacterium]
MKAFELLLPKTLDQAIEALPTEDTYAARGRAQILAGGQDLIGSMKDYLTSPELVVNLKSIPGLDQIRMSPEGDLEIGALVTLARLEDDADLMKRFPALVEAAGSAASPQIRAVGTVGGNLCQRPRCLYFRSEHAHCLKKGGTECFSYTGNSKYNAIFGGGPSYIVHPSDLAPVLVAYDAEVDLVGPSGKRSMKLADFYVLPGDGDPTKETVLAPNEVVVTVRVPKRMAGRPATYVKVRERDAFDFALSAVALVLEMQGDEIASASVVLGGVAPIPWRSPEAEEVLVGRRPDAEAAKAAGDAAVEWAEPLSMNEYKIPMTKGAIAVALERLAKP